jgi:peptidyl-prolyl cis-trans isomerase-like 4
MSVLLDTTQGEIVIDLFTEKCYRSSLNFLKLCKLKRYNFHPYSTVVKAEFQTDESIWGITQGKARNLFKPEIKFSHDKKGYVSFITEKVGELKLACSSFFIALDQNSRLDEQGAVFGIVVEGFDVLDRINNALCDQDNRPFVDIRIKHTIILEDPFEDIPDMDKFIPDSSPLPSKEMLKTVRLSSTNELLNEEQRNEKEKIQEMEARQLTLEMIGDLPFADVKPPENVLFICKLNPITRDSDLRMIFGRFGPLLG